MNKIILALDTTNLDEAINVSKKVQNKIFTIKLGLEFFNAHGKNGVKKFNEIGLNNLILDLKLKDIPETVYKAIKALNDINFGFITIHGQGGKSMIEKAKIAANEIKCKPKIMMVTILTALSDSDLKATGNNNTVAEQVKKSKPTIKSIHYVAPQVWVWRENRVKKFKKFLDHVLLLFNFEKKYFDKENIKNTFVGHPLLDKKISGKIDISNLISNNKKIISIFPGSRISEITTLMPILIDFFILMNKEFVDLKFIFHIYDIHK